MSIWSSIRNWFRFSMTDKQRASWERKRQQGVFVYILRDGFLFFGGLMFIGTLAIAHFFIHQPINSNLILDKALGSVFAGFLYGLFTGIINESIYNREKNLSILEDSSIKESEPLSGEAK